MFAVLLATALGGASPGPLADGTTVFVPAPAPVASAAPDELLLLAVQLDGLTLTEALTAYGDPADPLIPIGELSRLLDLPLDVRPAAGIATGRIGENQRAITVDLSAGKALIGTQTIALIPPDSKVTDSEIYLRASLLAKLLPVRIAASPEEMLLTLTATEKLPAQARRERRERFAGLTSEPSESDHTMRVATPYRWLGAPAFDIGLELAGDSLRGRPVTRFEGRAALDLLKTGVTGYLATDDRGKPSSARVRAERRSPDSNLLGPLGLSYMGAGDIYSPALALGPRSASGAGVFVSSARTEEASVFERINIRGDLPIGYDAELYVNDVLRNGLQGAMAVGRYDFADVPLVRGRNVIRIVLYGPRGERTERTQVINVGGGQLASGQTVIEAGVLALDRPVIRVSDDEDIAGIANRGSLRAVASLAHGISAGLTSSIGFGLYSDPEGRRHRVVSGGLRTSLAGMAIQADYGRDLSNGSAASLGAAGRVGAFNFLARHVEYDGRFFDETNSAWDSARAMQRFSELTFDMALPIPGKSTATLPLSGRVERAAFADGGTSLTARARTTVPFGDTLVALGADYSRRGGQGGKAERLSGDIAFSRFIDYKWQLRANADYQVRPDVALRSVGLTADRAIGERYSLRLGANRTFDESREFNLQAGLTGNLPFGDATLGGEYSTGQRRWRIGLQLNFGLAFDPLARAYRMTPPGPATGGSAAFQAFIDSNANGRRDAAEETVPAVALQGGAHGAFTDADGRAFVTGLGESSYAILRADVSNADTVFVAAPPQNIVLTPRAGTVARVDYPLVPTSELVVRLSFRRQSGERAALSAVRLQLVAASGEAMPGITEFDGTAVFDAIRPGTYRIELDPAQAARLGMALAQPLAVTVTGNGAAAQVQGEIVFRKESST